MLGRSARRHNHRCRNVWPPRRALDGQEIVPLQGQWLYQIPLKSQWFESLLRPWPMIPLPHNVVERIPVQLDGMPGWQEQDGELLRRAARLWMIALPNARRWMRTWLQWLATLSDDGFPSLKHRPIEYFQAAEKLGKGKEEALNGSRSIRSWQHLFLRFLCQQGNWRDLENLCADLLMESKKYTPTASKSMRNGWISFIIRSN